MQFCELSKKEYEQFEKQHRYCNFLNAVETMELEAALGWDTAYVGVKQDGIILCATPLVKMPVMRKFRYFYSPRGFLIDFDDKELLSYFVKQLKAYAKKQKMMYIVIDPNVLYKERDVYGDLVPNGFDNSRIVDTLESLGFIHQGFSTGYNKTMQSIRWMFSLSLEGKDEDSIWKAIHPKTKRSILTTIKNDIKVRELTYDELDIFYNIMCDTSERRNFENRDLNFYQQQVKSYEGKLKVLLAYLDANEYRSSIQKEIQLDIERKNQAEEILLKSETNKKAKNKLKVAEEAIEVGHKRIKEIDFLQEKYGEIIPMATSMFVYHGDEITYLTSGAQSDCRSFFASYALQWHVIKEGLKEGYKKYNFYGISGIFDEKDENYGVYKFKQRFDGQVEELIGDFVLPIQPFLYKIYKALRG